MNGWCLSIQTSFNENPSATLDSWGWFWVTKTLLQSCWVFQHLSKFILSCDIWLMDKTNNHVMSWYVWVIPDCFWGGSLDVTVGVCFDAHFYHVLRLELTIIRGTEWILGYPLWHWVVKVIFFGANTKVVPWSWCGKLRRAGGLRLWFFQLVSGCMGILFVFHMRTIPSHRPSSSNDLDLDCSCNAEANYHSSLLVGGICYLIFSYPKLSVSQDLRRLNPTSGVHHKTEWATEWRARMPLVVGWSHAVFFSTPKFGGYSI